MLPLPTKPILSPLSVRMLHTLAAARRALNQREVMRAVGLGASDDERASLIQLARSGRASVAGFGRSRLYTITLAGHDVLRDFQAALEN